MLKRIAAITFIFACTAAAWFVLGGSIIYRTYESNDRLKPGVASIWGASQEQRPPRAAFEIADANGKNSIVPLPIGSSRITVDLALEYRQKGLLWYSTYVVDFAGVYTFRNTAGDPHTVTFHLPFPTEHAVYDGVAMEINGRGVPYGSDKSSAFASVPLAAGELATLRVAYRSQGMESWRYRLGGDVVSQARDFALIMKTNFKDIDFPLNTLSPSEKRESGRGWTLTWRYQNLISGFQIGMTMPEKLQPGPVASQISFFAPVSLLLYFFVLFIVTAVRNIEIHPVNYFFLATAFFSFHLLFAYLVDRISIHLAFVICSAVSVFLVVSYLRIVAGARFAIVEAGAAQVIYLVLFSYAFLFKGFTGLTVTIGCIITLFVAMQVTARIHWAERFTRTSRPTESPL